MRLLKRLTKNERGLATVEAAIALPVLLLVLFGIMGAGLFVATKHELDRASREGARAAAIALITDEQLKNIADKILVITDKSTATRVRCKTATIPAMITVKLTGKVPLTVPFFDFAGTLSASTSIVPEWDLSSSSLPPCS